MEIRDVDSAVMIVTVECRVCYTPETVRVKYQDWRRWVAGTLIQNAFPYLNADERELLISKTCKECWDKLFAEEES